MARLISLAEAMRALNAGDDSWRRYQVSYPAAECGRYSLEVFDIPADDLGRMRIVREQGMARDTGYGTFRRLVETRPPEERDPANPRDNGRHIWMSDTRAEILEHKPLIDWLWWTESMPGAVLINGLGLGVAVHAALAHRGVTHVDVVERDPDIVALIGPHLPADKVTVHLADAFDITWPAAQRWKAAWHDIWPTICDLNLPEMRVLHRKYGRLAEWQASWQRKGCERMDRLVKAAAAEKERRLGLQPETGVAI